MSSLPGRIPPVQVREAAECMCTNGFECSSFAAGHALHLIQSRLAAATPTEWVDAIVERVEAHSGLVHVRTLADDTTIVVWNGAGAADAVAVGAPVGLHARYHVLADGRQWFNVSRLG